MIFASNNKGKIKEIKSIFNTEEVISLKEANVDIDVVEDADSFYGNALKKAKEIFELTNTAVIADHLDKVSIPDYPDNNIKKGVDAVGKHEELNC